MVDKKENTLGKKNKKLWNKPELLKMSAEDGTEGGTKLNATRMDVGRYRSWIG